MKNRWVILGAGIVIQIILGGLYAWSTFFPSLIKNYSLTKEECGFIFGLSVGVFALVTNLAGWLLSKKGPRITAFVGSILFVIGYMIASRSGGDYHTLILGLSVFIGSGIGFAYVCPLSVGMKWFPKKKGLVTGVAVAGFGGGAVLLSNATQYFLNSGMNILELFKWIAIVPGGVLVVATLFLSDPPQEKTGDGKTASFGDAWSLPFGVLLLGMFSGTFAGLLVIGHITSIIVDSGFTAQQAVTAVSLLAIGNAIGRVTWGWVFDKIHYKCIPLSLGLFSALMMGLVFANSPNFYYVLATLIGFCFGGCFVIYATAVSSYFGTESFSRLYPLCMLSYGVAGLTGPKIGGRIADTTGSYDTALYLSFGILIVAAIITGIGLIAFKNVEKEQKEEIK